jgi:riboflavin-specific deaminase-like protein
VVTAGRAPTSVEWDELLRLAAGAKQQGSAFHASGGRREPTARDERTAALAAIVEASAGTLTAEVYAPFVTRLGCGPLTVAQIGQSLDGRIATVSGHSHYINGEAALDHLHRLRALVDAVVVGAGTVATDDPELTTRRVKGPNPVRVVIDPHARLDPDRRVFDGRAPCLRVVAAGAGTAGDGGCGKGYVTVALPAAGGRIQPASIVSELRRRGLSALLIEGGSHTVSQFLAAGQIACLHVLVAPLLLGSGRCGLDLPPVERVGQGIWPSVHVHPLGTDTLFACELGDIGVAATRSR